MKIMPPTYFVVLLIMSISLHFFLPVLQFSYFPFNYFGFVFIILGIVLNLWADSVFKKKNTTVKPNELPNVFIADGPFRFSRNPMYLGMFAILLGSGIFLGSLISFITPLVFVILIEVIFIPTEEQGMEKEFGSNYLKYKKKVRRWL